MRRLIDIKKKTFHRLPMTVVMSGANVRKVETSLEEKLSAFLCKPLRFTGTSLGRELQMNLAAPAGRGPSWRLDSLDRYRKEKKRLRVDRTHVIPATLFRIRYFRMTTSGYLSTVRALNMFGNRTNSRRAC